ncbi:MAG: hypothetical protein WD354_08210 [Acidimicrobiia bacterium]
METRESFTVTDVRLPDSTGLVDIFVDKGRISRLVRAATSRDGRTEYAGNGHLVLPRFIDVHSHADARVWFPTLSVDKSVQGIGHEIVGNCGLGPAPSAGSGRGWRAILSGVGIAGPPGWEFADIDEYLAQLQGNNRGIPPRLSTLLPYGAVRATVGDLRRQLDSAEVTEVASLIERGLASTVGVSMGLVYPPNDGATWPELMETLRPLSDGGVLAVHMRSQANLWIEAVDEVLQLAGALRLRLLISHLCVGGHRNQWKVDWVLARLRAARDQGIDVYFDQHPYSAGSTSFTQLIPGEYLRSGHDGVEIALPLEQLMEILASPSNIPGWENYLELVGPDHILIAGSEVAPDLAGKTVGQVATELSIHPVAAIEAITRRTGGRATMVLTDLYDEDRIDQIVREPNGVISTDSVHVALPHPRLYGTYPYAFSRFVRGKVITESEFVHRTSSLPAEIFGLDSGGGIALGSTADFLVVDPLTFGHEPDYLDPARPVTGIVLQVIEGRPQMAAAS